MGNDILSTLTAGPDFNEVNEEEGIVLRDAKVFGTEKPVKITGNFLLGAEGGKLAKRPKAAVKAKKKAGIITLITGGFKPPHAGHNEMAKR